LETPNRSRTLRHRLLRFPPLPERDRKWHVMQCWHLQSTG